jgi:transcriptional regulator with XRE-family HTH domain
MTNVNTFEELFAELNKDPEFRKEYDRQKPYYDLILEIVRRRNELNFTQKDLAERSGTHQSSISRIESGEHDIRLGTLIAIAEALKAKVEIRLVPIFYVEDEEYTSLFDTSADNVPKETRTTHLKLSGEIAGI